MKGDQIRADAFTHQCDGLIRMEIIGFSKCQNSVSRIWTIMQQRQRHLNNQGETRFETQRKLFYKSSLLRRHLVHCRFGG